jgi:hypothetical protein
MLKNSDLLIYILISAYIIFWITIKWIIITSFKKLTCSALRLLNSLSYIFIRALRFETCIINVSIFLKVIVIFFICNVSCLHLIQMFIFENKSQLLIPFWIPVLKLRSWANFLKWNSFIIWLNIIVAYFSVDTWKYKVTILAS